MNCQHTDQIQVYDDGIVPGSTGCEECLKTGGKWLHLRICLTCGHVGCCNSSPGKHATAHFHETNHPIVQSFEPGESWKWCYIDQDFVVDA